jgi:hypothetical protein
MPDELKPIGTVIALTGEYRGSWLKINHGIDTPPDLMVKHFADAKKALDTEDALRQRSAEAVALLREARQHLSTYNSRTDSCDDCGNRSWEKPDHSEKCIVRRYDAFLARVEREGGK